MPPSGASESSLPDRPISLPMASRSACARASKAERRRIQVHDARLSYAAPRVAGDGELEAALRDPRPVRP